MEKLKADPEMTRRFSDAYGRSPDRASLLDAIATYVRSLRTPGSRFDLWLGGDASALSPEELEGYRLFKSYGCVSFAIRASTSAATSSRVTAFFVRSLRRSLKFCARAQPAERRDEAAIFP